MKDLALRPTSSNPRFGEGLHFFRVLLVLTVGLRLIYATMLQLVPDEAFYWTWSRHLAAGYFDHPPMIAYLIWAGVHAVGSTELGVRLVGVLMAMASMAIIVFLAKRVLRETRAAVWVAVIWLTSPLLAGLGTILTPDTPVTFFSVCALAFALLIADRDDQPRPPSGVFQNAALWLLFGFFCGLAMLSKYTGVLLPGSVALATLFSRKGRCHYRRPWIYLSGILAVIVFSPVIIWNARHHWASFLFQLRHGATADTQAPRAVSLGGRVVLAIKDLGAYVGGQAGVWTPILFAITLVVLVVFWRRYVGPSRSRSTNAPPGRRPLTQVDVVLLWAGTLPLVLFGVATLRAHHTEANWPAFSYFPISLLIARWLGENWTGRRVNWARAGVQVALGITVVMHVLLVPPVTAALLRLPYRFPHVLRDFTGHREVGRVLGQWSSQTFAPVVTNRHEDAGEAAFYMPGQPDVWCVGIGSRPTAFDYFDEQPDFGKIPRVLWVGGHADRFMKEFHYAEEQRLSALFFAGKNSRSLTAYVLVRPQR